MKILYLVPYTPTIIRTRPYNLVRSLIRAGNSVTIATCWEGPEEVQSIEFLKSSGVRVIAQPLNKVQRLWNILTALISGKPMQSRYSWQPKLVSDVMHEINMQAFDILHVEHLRGAIYGIQLHTNLQKLGLNPPIIWDSVDCISYLFDQAAHKSRNFFGKFITRFELSRTKKFEASMGSQFDRILVTSKVDSQAFEGLEGFSPVHPVVDLPNGVDLEYFSPATSPHRENVVLFSGKLSYHANVTAALHLVQEIMPYVWERKPDTIVQLAGKDPDPAIRAIARSDPRIEVTGTVADLRPFLRLATVSTAPILYGAGIQNKVLEAMACGTPVIAYPAAVSGLRGVKDREEILLAHNPSEFGRLVALLLDDNILRSNLARNAISFVSINYSWERIGDELLKIYQLALDQKHTLPSETCLSNVR